MRYLVLLLCFLFSVSVSAQTTLMSLITWEEPTEWEGTSEPLNPSDISGYSVNYEITGAGQLMQDVVSIEGNQIQTVIATPNALYGAEYVVRARVMSHTFTGAKSEWSEWGSKTIVANGVISIVAPPGIMITCEPSCVIAGE